MDGRRRRQHQRIVIRSWVIFQWPQIITTMMEATQREMMTHQPTTTHHHHHHHPRTTMKKMSSSTKMNSPGASPKSVSKMPTPNVSSDANPSNFPTRSLKNGFKWIGPRKRSKNLRIWWRMAIWGRPIFPRGRRSIMVRGGNGLVGIIICLGIVRMILVRRCRNGNELSCRDMFDMLMCVCVVCLLVLMLMILSGKYPCHIMHILVEF